MKYLVVGTAGHIDHGKSTLVRVLTGIDPDRLEEEKRRGITIDLGFAHLDLGDGLRAAFVDVPGHERFVKNMLAGASGIDLVMLVIAADESIKPQTREHFDICTLLGVRQGLIAITKADLVSQDLVDLVRLEAQELVAGSFLEGAPMVAVSARSGEGLESLKSALRHLSLQISPKSPDLPFRIPIDRAFVMKGFGAVVTGTLIAGQIEKEAEVEIFPLRRRVRVRGIEVHNQPAEVARAGQRTALNLAGIEPRELERGMVLAAPGLFENTASLDSVLSLLPSAPTLKTRSTVHFHCGTAEQVGEVILLEAKELKPGGRAYAQLRLAKPSLFLPGDRFIIRRFSPVTTIGGGRILDSQPPRHRWGDPHTREFLEVMEQDDPTARLEALARQSGEIGLGRVVTRTGWQPAEVLRLMQPLQQRQRLVLLGQPASLCVHIDHFRAVQEAVLKTLDEFHAANPLIAGIPKEELRMRLKSQIPDARFGHDSPPSAALFNAVLERLGGQVEAQGEMVRRAGRGVQLSNEEQAAKLQISRAFETAGLSVPNAKEVLGSLRLDRARAEKILHILLREKILVKVSEDLIFHTSALNRLRELVTLRKGQSSRIDVPIFKEMTGLTRKYAIPLLEYLDRERVTRRQGDERIIL